MVTATSANLHQRFRLNPGLGTGPSGQWLWLYLALLWATASFAQPSNLAASAAALQAQLVQKILPYWFDTTLDPARGGYLLADDTQRPLATPAEKQLVTQARMIWGFSHAHLHGLEAGRRDYLQAAAQGYAFLQDHFRDRQFGGYFWTTDLAGHPLNTHKIVYGQSFVIYALVEYSRASGEAAALRQAQDLYHVLQQHAHDPRYGGWVEHFERDWTPLLSPTPEAIVEVAGYKSANTHLHLMEALTELYAATKDAEVKVSLREALRLNQTYFYPKNPGRSSLHRHLDWSPVTDPASAGVSYGHNVEFAWLMVRAQRVLGQEPSWKHFDAHLEHALAHGFDHARGGLYSRGVGDGPATDTDKIWWVQAELLAALTDALQHRPNPAYTQALEKLLSFISTCQAEPVDGIWLETVTADGRPKSAAKAHQWKANYHDVRAMVKFVEAFGKPTAPAPRP